MSSYALCCVYQYGLRDQIVNYASSSSPSSPALRSHLNLCGSAPKPILLGEVDKPYHTIPRRTVYYILIHAERTLAVVALKLKKLLEVGLAVDLALKGSERAHTK